MSIKETNVNVTSLYGASSRLPLVSLAIQDTVTQMSPAKAREVALMLLECAEASEVDAFLWEFTAKELQDKAAGFFMVQQYRKWRELNANK